MGLELALPQGSETDGLREGTLRDVSTAYSYPKSHSLLGNMLKNSQPERTKRGAGEAPASGAPFCLKIRATTSVVTGAQRRQKRRIAPGDAMG